MKIVEDYSWVSGYLALLKELTLPIDFTEIQGGWHLSIVQIDSVMITLQHIDRGAKSISKELIRLGCLHAK
jgi:hypothetical protein